MGHPALVFHLSRSLRHLANAVSSLAITTACPPPMLLGHCEAETLVPIDSPPLYSILNWGELKIHSPTMTCSLDRPAPFTRPYKRCHHPSHPPSQPSPSLDPCFCAPNIVLPSVEPPSRDSRVCSASPIRVEPPLPFELDTTGEVPLTPFFLYVFSRQDLPTRIARSAQHHRASAIPWPWAHGGPMDRCRCRST
jgi:hypothetical protein